MKSTSLFRSGGIAAFAVLLILVTTFMAYGITQEVPIGNLSGTVLMGKDGKPLANAAIILRPKTNDDLGSARVRFLRADKNGKFSARNLPTALYDIEVSAVAHTLPRTQILIEEGKSKSLDLKLNPIDPYLTLYANQHVFMPSEEPAVQVHGFTPVKSIDVRLYRVPINELVKDKDFYRTFSPIARAESPEVLSKSNPNIQLAQQFEWPIVPNDSEGTFKRQLALKPLAPGFYFLRLQAGAATRGTYLLVSEIGVVAKRAKGKLHLFASHLETGKPIPGAPVTLAQGSELNKVGETDAKGRLTTTLPAPPINTSLGTAVLATLGDSAAVITFNDYRLESDDLKAYITTDRPIYRPGDAVQFKAIVRRPNGSGYVLPSETTASYEVQDLESRVIKRGSSPVTGFGTFSGDFMLPEGSTESVRLIVKVGQSESEKYVNVAAYRKPEFKIAVTPLRDYYLRGDVVQMRVKCEYYFGGPVAGAKISGSVGKSPLYSWVDPETGEEESYGSDWEGEYLTEVAGVTDANGEAVISYNTSELKWGSWDSVDQSLVFSVFGSEGDDRYFDAKGSVKLLQGDITIRADQDRWVVSPGQDAEVTLQLSAPDMDMKAVANRTIQIETGYEVWDEKGSVFTVERRSDVVTDRAGQAKVKVSPSNPGQFRIRATSLDRRGRPVQSNAWLYCYREGFDFGGPQPELQITLDKKSYSPGENVTALIRSKAKGGSVWVTLETDDIRDERVVEIRSGLTSVEFPVTAEMKPNAFISASLIREKGYASTQRRLSVKLDREKLNVSVTSDRGEYKPGETANYTIRARHHDGTPARAEIALGVVDEAIYAIAEDDDDPLEAFYPVRSSLINTFYSFPELYLDGGDKGSTDVEIRDNFVDTASWSPHVVTDAEGNARVSIQLPDNLTSWRATATAVTTDTQVGKTTQNLVVKKELMVRLAAPVALNQLDELTLTANVNNGTDSPMEVKVKLNARGASIADAAEKSVTVEPGKASQVTWQVSCPEPGEAIFEATAFGPNSLSDGMRVKVPIAAHATPEINGGAGQFTGNSKEITLVVSPEAKRGQLVINGSPSLAAPIIGSLEALVDFPYGCAEQTMSRFVPAVIARNVLRELKIDKPDLFAKTEEVSRQSLLRIRSMQASDGGWGWFESESAHPATTAIVLEGLAAVQMAGQPVDRLMLDNGVDWGRRWLRTEESRRFNPEDRIAIAYAILLFGPNSDASQVLIEAPLRWRDVEEKQDRVLSTEALAQIALGLAENQAPPAVNQRQRALYELWSRARIREDSISWPDDWGIRNTARGLEVLSKLSPDDPRLEKIVNGIILQRKGQYWSSTLDSSRAIQALLPVLRKSGGFAESTSISLQINGEPVPWTEYGAGAAVGLNEARVKLSDLKPGENKVTLSLPQGGTGFYSYTFEQHPFAKTIEPRKSAVVEISRTFHSLAAQRMEDGTMRLMPSTSPVTQIATGDTVRCIVKINAKEALEYAMVEVPIPSNLKASLSPVQDEWNFWFTGINVLDDRVAFFARQIPQGESSFELNLRAESVGSASALPAYVVEMYSPETQAATGSARFEVTK